LDPYCPLSWSSALRAASYTCGPGRKLGTPIEKLMMSRPEAFNCLAFSAICMIALGLARLIRVASFGMEILAEKSRA
jgi:hypothetical protein